MHPRRLARSVAKNEFARSGWDMKYFPLQWRGAVKLTLERKEKKHGRRVSNIR